MNPSPLHARAPDAPGLDAMLDRGAPAENTGPTPAAIASPTPATIAGATRERAVTFGVDGGACRRCARRAEEALRGARGVREVSVEAGGERARVRYDPGLTSEDEISAAAARAGFRVQRRDAVERAPRRLTDGRVIACLAALVGVVALALAVGERRAPLGTAIAELALAAIAVGTAWPAIEARGSSARPWGARGGASLASAAAIAALAVGAIEAACAHPPATGRSLPAWIAAIAAHAPAWRGSRAWGAEVAAGIAAVALVARAVASALRGRALRGLVARERARAVAVRRIGADGVERVARCDELAPLDRVRLAPGERAPRGILLEVEARVAEPDAAGELVSAQKRAGDVVAAGSVILSEGARGRVLGAGPDLAAAMDAEVLVAIARVDDPPEPGLAWSEVTERSVIAAAVGFAGFALVVHGCLARSVASPLAVSSALAALAAASISAFALAAPTARAIAIGRARVAGAIVRDTAALTALARAGAARFDAVTIALAAGSPPAAHAAPIVVCAADTAALAALLDIGRALRSALRWSAALAIAYNAAVIPAAAIGLIAPPHAVALALVEALAGLAIAARLLLAGRARREPVSRAA